jgi:hypothetical protein
MFQSVNLFGVSEFQSQTLDFLASILTLIDSILLLRVLRFPEKAMLLISKHSFVESGLGMNKNH